MVTSLQGYSIYYKAGEGTVNRGQNQSEIELPFTNRFETTSEQDSEDTQPVRNVKSHGGG